MTPGRPAFRPGFRVAVVDGEGVYLLSEDERRVLTGRLALLVAPLLDGSRTVDEIAAELEGSAAADEVREAVAKLDAAGHLARPAARREATVEVVALGAAADVDLELPGLRVGTPGEVLLALTDDYLHEALAAVAEDGRPWLIAKPVGDVLWIGPFFRPGVPGCWRCLATRLRENRPIVTNVDSRVGPASTPATWSPASAAAGVALAAAELVRRIAEPERKDATVWTLDLRSGDSARHVLRRDPHCPACGEPRGGPAPVDLRGGPGEPLDLEQHVSPITGVVTTLRRSELPASLDLVHHYVAGYSLGVPQSLGSVRKALRSSGVGTAPTDGRARAAAIGEAIERSAAVRRGDEPARRASLNELGAAAVAPNDWLLYSERQLASLGGPLDPDMTLDWSPVWSLTRGEWRYLPTRTLYYAWASGDPVWLWADSNGNAAGATLEDALLGGIHELVERDATAIWWWNRVRRPAVDLASFDDPFVHAVVARLEQLGRSLWVLDLTADIDVPVFVAVTRRADGPDQQLLMGYGAHVAADGALRRAVGELMQHVVGVADARRAGHRVYDQPGWARWLQTATVEGQPHLVPSGEPARTAADFARSEARDVRALLEQRGLELLVLDLTRPEVGVPVAKAIVPGLRPAFGRFAPGRLYDVPVDLGWLDRRLAEDELNPDSRPL